MAPAFRRVSHHVGRLAKGVPMVVINPIPGEESCNPDHLLEEGIAYCCNNLPVLAYKYDRLIDARQASRTYGGNAPALGNPRWSFTILDRLDNNFAHETKPNLSRRGPREANKRQACPSRRWDDTEAMRTQGGSSSNRFACMGC